MGYARITRYCLTFLSMFLLSACSLAAGRAQEVPTPTPSPIVLGAPKVPEPVSTPEGFGPVPTPVPTALPTATPYPAVIPKYASRCGLPAPRPYPEAASFVGYLTPTPEADLVISDTFDIWCYQVLRIQGHLVSDVSYDRSSVDALNAFAATNREIATQLANDGGKAQMLLYFRSPMTPAEFRDWVSEHGVAVDMTLGDCDNCPTGGLGWRMATREDPYPGANEFPEYHLAAVGLWGSVDATRLPAIASSPAVFIADLAPNIVLRALAKAGVVGAESLEMIPDFDAMPIWPMRELGVQRFEYQYP